MFTNAMFINAMFTNTIATNTTNSFSNSVVKPGAHVWGYYWPTCLSNYFGQSCLMTFYSINEYNWGGKTRCMVETKMTMWMLCVNILYEYFIFMFSINILCEYSMCIFYTIIYVNLYEYSIWLNLTLSWAKRRKII